MASARLVGINHVALEVGDVDAALEFYGRLFDFELRGRAPCMAFIDMGDQFVAISRAAGRSRPTRSATSASSSTTRRRCAGRQGGRRRDLPGRGLDFHDP